MNVIDEAIEVARDRGLSTDSLLTYDFGDGELMTKPEKSQLIREFLKPDDFCFELITASEFIVDFMATIRKVPLS